MNPVTVLDTRRKASPADDVLTLNLDALRQVGDPLADDAVAAYFVDIDAHHPGELFSRLVQHVKLPAEEQVPAIQAFFEHAQSRPGWVDEQAVARGQEFFNRLVVHHFSALYLASLPNSYAAAKGVQVLRMTGRLQNDTNRRLNETAQLLMDMAAPGAMAVGGTGIDRILHVRLMHAAVRWMIAHDPSVRRVENLPPPQREEDGLVWSRSWGLPVNQEDLLGTWLTFTSVVYDAFDASGVDFDEQNVADHLHLWRVAAHYLGVDPALVPTTRAAADSLRRFIFGRQQSPSAAGKAMTAALLAQSYSRIPKFARPLMPTAFRHFLGNPVSDMIGIPEANWTRHLFGILSTLTTVMTRGEERNPLHARLDAWIGRHLMDAMLLQMRNGVRPAYRIPTHLDRRSR